MAHDEVPVLKLTKNQEVLNLLKSRFLLFFYNFYQHSKYYDHQD